MSFEQTTERPYGLPVKLGCNRIAERDWRAIVDFIKSKIWKFGTPCLVSDEADPLTAMNLSYGALLLGFDFHITSDGPRLIEINTNAGGLASAIYLNNKCDSSTLIEKKFTDAIRKEYALACPDKILHRVAIVDDQVTTQPLFSEMRFLADCLQRVGIRTTVVSPEVFEDREDGLYENGERIELIYNRLTDFRLQEATHANLRQAALKGNVILTPHPAAYVRIADKRNLIRLKHPLNPVASLLRDRPLSEWISERHRWVFKPPQGAGSKGVYRGDKISVSKLQTLPPDTLVQGHVLAPRSEDGSKYDLRVYTRDDDILAMVSRHFTGQVMEMQSLLSGVREAVPESACCFAKVDVT